MGSATRCHRIAGLALLILQASWIGRAEADSVFIPQPTDNLMTISPTYVTIGLPSGFFGSKGVSHPIRSPRHK